LTQLILGVDRNSEVVSPLFDERDEAVKEMIAEVIQIAIKKKKYIGICGQAPSDFPEFAVFLMEQGIQSMSLNPDTVWKTTLKLAEAEGKINMKKNKGENEEDLLKEKEKDHQYGKEKYVFREETPKKERQIAPKKQEAT